MENQSFMELATAVLAIAVLGIMLAWNTRRVWVRLSGTVLCAFASLLMLFSLTHSFGTPKLSSLETYKAEKAEILSARMREGVGIYLWLMLPGISEPRYYKMPWNQDLAQALQDAIRQQKEGEGLMMDMPFENSWDKRKPPRVYPVPQPKMPDKPQQRQAPVYKQQDL